MATTEKGLRLMFVNWTEDCKKDGPTDENVGDAETRDMEEGEESADITHSEKTEYTITPNTEGYTTGYTRKIVTTTKKTKITVDNSKKKTTIQDYTSTVTYTSTFTRSDGLVITKSNTTATKIGDTTGVVPSLLRITFNREVYKPNEVVADLQLKSSSTLSNADIQSLTGKEVKIIRYTSTNDGGSTSESTDATYTGFYIYDVLPMIATGKNLIVRAHIFSLDHQLTRKKYSRTYVGKKLFNDILLEGITKFSTAYTKATPNYFWKPSCLAIPFPTYYKDYEDKDDIIDRSDTKPVVIQPKCNTKLDHLSYGITTTDGTEVDKEDGSGKEKADLKILKERIQPYLVQYNESFYDFMVRTCNRCGEFFFWDNGALRVGRTAAGTGTEIKTSDCLSVFYAAIHTPDDKTSFDNDYYTLDDLNDLGKAPKLNTSAQGKSLDTITDNDGFFYNDEVNHDVYRTRIYKEKWDDFDSEMVGNENKYGVSFLSKVLNSTSIFDIVKGYGAYELFRTAEAAAARDYTNRTYDELYIPPKTVDKSGDKDTCLDKRPHLLERRDDGETVTDYISLFTTAATDGHLDSEFYHKIRKEEELLSKQLIIFNLSEPKKFAIGQEITYNRTKYVVIQIKDNPATNSTNKDYFSAIDPDAATPFAQMGTAVMQVVAIPLNSDSEVYPPLHPAGHFLRSEPQVALVAEINDPQKRGRVRIVYPWQQREDTEPSPWIRVLTPSAVGAAFEFNVGNEVLIDYEAGNIERPYVAGALFNRQNSAPSRGDMAFVSKNGHSIKFSNPIDDRYFATSISPAYGWVQKLIGPSAHGTKDSLKLTGGITISDAYGFYKIAMSTDQRKIDIASPFGDVKISAFTGITLSAPNGNINIKGQNINIEAGNKLTLTSGTNIRDKSYLGFVHKDGEGKNEASNFFATLLGEKIFEGAVDFMKPLITGIDLNLLRTIIQVFLRPIDGTMEIHSFKYMLLEAGKGEATVQPDRYKPDKIREEWFWRNPTISHSVSKQRAIKGYHGTLTAITTLLDTIIADLITKKAEMATKKGNYVTALGRVPTQNGDQAIRTADDILHANENLDKPKTYTRDDLNVPNRFPANDANVRALVNAANEYAAAIVKYYKATRSIGSDSQKKAKTDFKFKDTNPDTFHYDKLGKTAKEAMTKVYNYLHDTNHQTNWDTLSNQNASTIKIMAKHWWFELVVKNGSELVSTTPLDATASNWAAFVTGLSESPQEDWKTKLGMKTLKYLASPLSQYVDAFDQTFTDWNRWDSGKDGQIIFSEKSDKSYYFDEHANLKWFRNGFDDVTVQQGGQQVIQPPGLALVSLKTELTAWN